MPIRYEANPPKILPHDNLEQRISKFVDKINAVSGVCDAVHLTEDVLGFRRVSPISVGKTIRRDISHLPITASLRVRDKTENQIQKFVDDCIEIGFSGILILMGDPSHEGRRDSGEIPSAVVKSLHSQGIDSKIDLYLSIPSRPNFEKLGKKIDACPKGFITQVIQSPKQVQDINDRLPEFKVIPIILFPSENNVRSAKFLNINMTSYEKNFGGFIDSIHSITRDVLITSPNDFGGLEKFLKNWQGINGNQQPQSS